MNLNILLWLSLSALTITCNAESLDRKRRLSLASDYAGGAYSLDSSPFETYVPRIPKSIASGITFPHAPLNSIYNGYSKDSQDFNVGYSLSLDGGGKNFANAQSSLYNLGLSDVVTGSPKQYASKYTSFGQTQKLIESPRMQNYYAAHAPTDTLIGKKGIWKSVSPNVEIFQSKEIQLGNDLSSKSFDHQKALGRSQGFEYSDVIDGQRTSYDAKPAQSNVDLFANYQSPSHLTSDFAAGDLTASQNQPQYNYKPLKSQQDIDAAFKNTPKFPLDTHLLKEAGISSGGETKGAHVLPVQIDTSGIEKFKSATEDYIKTAMRQKAAASQHVPQQLQSQFAAYQSAQQQYDQFSRPHHYESQVNQQSAQPTLLTGQRQQSFGANGNLVNFNEQKMLHFDNPNANSFNPNVNSAHENVQRQHGFRSPVNAPYALDNSLTQSFGNANNKPLYNSYRFNNNFRNVRESTYKNDNNVDLKPPPLVRPRYRVKNNRFH